MLLARRTGDDRARAAALLREGAALADAAGVRADRRRSYCLYEAPSPDAILAAARRANVPVDKVIEVDRFVPAEHRG